MPLVYKFSKGTATNRREDGWNGKSRDHSTGGPSNKVTFNKNHDSKMDQAEVLRLVRDGVAKFVGKAKEVKDSRDRLLIELLNYATSSRPADAIIGKGIHQRTTKPHITVRVAGLATLHIWLTEKDSGLPVAAGATPSFVWDALGVSATEAGPMFPATSVVGVKRRGSISYSVMVNEKRRIAEEEGKIALRDAIAELGAINWE